MAFFAYLLRCSDRSYYAGHTDNLERRIAQHHYGEIGGYTHTRRPVELMWSQDFPSRLEALETERRIKGWTRRKKEALIRGDWADLHDAAIPPSERALRLGSGPSTSLRPFGFAQDDRAPPPNTNPNTVRAERSRSTRAAPPIEND